MKVVKEINLRKWAENILSKELDYEMNMNENSEFHDEKVRLGISDPSRPKSPATIES